MLMLVSLQDDRRGFTTDEWGDFTRIVLQLRAGLVGYTL